MYMNGTDTSWIIFNNYYYLKMLTTGSYLGHYVISWYQQKFLIVWNDKMRILFGNINTQREARISQVSFHIPQLMLWSWTLLILCIYFIYFITILRLRMLQENINIDYNCLHFSTLSKPVLSDLCWLEPIFLLIPSCLTFRTGCTCSAVHIALLAAP